jgi:SAM-dependent methyltransferase
LFDWLAAIAPRRSLAWDCAAGSGQATLDLAARFEHVIATDASRAQIEAAPAHPGVEYRVATAEDSGLPAASADLVVVAQALHWFDLERFCAEARRVLAQDGVIAVWSYGMMQIDPALDPLLQAFYSETVGPYWPPERKLVEDGYADLPFPFHELATPAFEMQSRWSLEQLLGYLRSWSATSRFLAAHGYDPVAELARDLAPLWGEGQRLVKWPLALRAGQGLP